MMAPSGGSPGSEYSAARSNSSLKAKAHRRIKRAALHNQCEGPFSQSGCMGAGTVTEPLVSQSASLLRVTSVLGAGRELGVGRGAAELHVLAGLVWHKWC